MNTGVTGISAADEIVVAMGHLRGLGLRPPMLGQPRPQQDGLAVRVLCARNSRIGSAGLIHEYSQVA